MVEIYALLVGIAMGFLIQRVGASSPRLILRNLRLENLSVIKFMALTIAVGMLVSFGLGALGVTTHFEIKPTYVIGVALGGLIFGVGFAVGGYCPGTCVVGVGEGRKDAWFAVLGGVVGSIAFTLLYGTLLGPIIQPMDYGKLTLFDALHLPALVVALVMGILMLVVIAKLPTEVQAGK